MELAPSESGVVWRQRRLPERGRVAGYAALIDALDLRVPVPVRLAGIGEKHVVVDTAEWKLLTPRHAPASTLAGQLAFALKWEGVDLAVLKRTFEATGPGPIEALVRGAPSGAYARRIGYLFEWLTGTSLAVRATTGGRYIDLVDPGLQYVGEGRPVPRFRVRDNLPGTRAFCPMVRRTPALEDFVAAGLVNEAREVTARVPGALVARAAAFLLLQDSRASFAIEGERSSHARIQRWSRAIGQAGRAPLTVPELLRLQALVIGDSRFVKLGLRKDFGFVGEHDRETHLPIPAHLDARPEDLEDLVAGLLAFAAGARDLDPVIAAAVLAFGFVYVHPFVDGNGRLHRYLVHHVLAERGFNPPGFVFPVSAAILDRVDDYAQVLESYSSRLLEVIDWRPRPDGNIEVLNDTADFYRYFDATPHATFLFECVQRTIRWYLPREAEFLARYDRWKERVQSLVDMPEATLDLLLKFLSQHQGRLSRRARSKEFKALQPSEVTIIEEAFDQELGDFLL